MKTLLIVPLNALTVPAVGVHREAGKLQYPVDHCIGQVGWGLRTAVK
jgi:hypothetical protein